MRAGENGEKDAAVRRPLSVCVVSVGDPLSFRRWSGSTRSITLELARSVDSLKTVSLEPLRKLFAAANRVARRLQPGVDLLQSAVFSRLFGFIASLHPAVRRSDLVVVICGSAAAAHLRTPVPMVYISDTTFALVGADYPAFSAFPDWLKRQADDLERRTLRRADRVVLPARWSRRSAVEDYGVDPARILLAPFGGNLPEAILRTGAARPAPAVTRPIRILHVTADWARKGGPIVVETMRRLRGRGLDARAVLVGRIPAELNGVEGVEVIGFVDKASPEGMQRLADLYRSSDLHVLPTQADCYPIVFSESQAFGLPSIACDVGGVRDALQDGDCGVVLPAHATAEDFAQAAHRIVSDPGLYERMSSASRGRYEAVANWPAYVRAVLAFHH